MWIMVMTNMRRPPAPVPAADLAGALRPLGRSRMLPAAAYISSGVLAWELEHFFARSWSCVGRSDELTAGGHRVVRAGEIGVLLTRDDAGVLRGFANVCRHRGHELLPTGGSAGGRAVTCPYHAWSYRLDGSLLAAPGFVENPDFAVDDHGLVALPVTQWHGWLFVSGYADPPAFAEHVGALAALVAPYSPGRLVRGAGRDYLVAANWKVISENYHECYHCPQIHPELCRVSPPDSGVNFDLPGAWVGGEMDLAAHAETMSLDGRSGGVPIPGLTDHSRRTVAYLGLFPDLLISLHPDYVLTHRLEPLTPGCTRVTCEWLFPPEALEQARFDPAYAVDFWDRTNGQDWAACESVQRGISSPHFSPGPLAPNEDAVHRFVTLVAGGYLGNR